MMFFYKSSIGAHCVVTFMSKLSIHGVFHCVYIVFFFYTFVH